VRELLTAALPLLGLAVAGLAGIGITAVLAPSLPGDAQGALAPLAGFALLAAASTLLPYGATTGVLAPIVLAAGVAVTVAARRHLPSLRAAAAPAAVAVGALVLAAIPAAARGSWEATSLYGSTDSYHWVSQGRAYLDGPAPEPVTEHPDRLTYERSRDQQWAVALPFALGQLAWVGDADPADAYGALAALVYAFLPLATYAAARALLGWSPQLALAAGSVIALNASLLFASHFSWQQQLAGSALAFAAAALLRLGLEPTASRRLLVLAALLVAGALATYRLGFAPYLAALLALVVATTLVTGRDRGDVARRAGAFAGAAALFALPSLVALRSGLPEFVDAGGFSTAFKEHFPAGQPGEALGLVPRVWAIEEDWPAAIRVTWLVAASLLALVLLVGGVRSARRLGRADFVLAGSALVLGGWLVLLLPAFAPYLSYKLLAYGAPFLVLLVLAPFAGRRTRATVAAAAVGGVFLAASALVATIAPVDARRTLELVGVVPADATVSFTTDDAWEEAWTVYRLRDVRVSVETPTYLLTEQGRKREATAYRHRPVTHEAVLRGDRIVVAPASG
jgi:hypothetical protein